LQLTTPDDTLQLLRSCVFDTRLITPAIADYALQQLKRDGVKKSLAELIDLLGDHKDQFQVSMEAIQNSALPGLVVWGKQDLINPPDTADPSRFKASWQWLDECGHLPHIEKRSEVNLLLRQFIAEQLASDA